MGSCSVWGLQFKVSPMRFWDAPDRCMARSRARAAFRSMRSGGCIDVGRGGALGPFSDPADLTKHLAVFSPAFPPAHNRYGPHCRRRHRRSHRRRVPSIRFDAPYTVPPTRPDAMFLRVLACAACVGGCAHVLWVQP